MKRSISILLVTAATVAFAPIANAVIVLQIIHVDDTALDPLLISNGWMGVILRLHASAPGELVTAVDLKNDTGAGTPGITGPIHQAWAISTATGHPNLATPLDDPSLSSTDGNGTWDSFFNQNINWLATPDPATEDNNLANIIPNPPQTPFATPYTASPLTDIASTGSGKTAQPGWNFGVGTMMTIAGAIVPSNATSDLDLAFLIVPRHNLLLSNTVTFKARVFDQSDPGQSFQIDEIINGYESANLPEPTSLGLLGLGTLSTLARRRTR